MQPFVNHYGEKLTPADVPKEIRVLFYNLHTMGRKQKKAVPVITVALAVHNNGDVVGRGIAVCSPDDIHCHCKKEGHIRALGRAIRAYKRAVTSKPFAHPNAISTLKRVFSYKGYKDYKWHFHNSVALKHEYMPTLSKFEEGLLDARGF